MFTKVLIKFYIDRLHSSNIVAFLLEIALCRVLVCYCLKNLCHGLLTNIQLMIIFVKSWSVQFHCVKVWTYSISWRAVREVLTRHCIWQIAVERALCSLSGLTTFTLSSSQTPTPTHLPPLPTSYVTTITLTSTTTAKLFATRVSAVKVSKDLVCLQTYHYLMVLVGFLTNIQLLLLLKYPC